MACVLPRIPANHEETIGDGGRVLFTVNHNFGAIPRGFVLLGADAPPFLQLSVNVKVTHDLNVSTFIFVLPPKQNSITVILVP